MRNESPTFMSTNSTAIIFGYKFIVGFIACLCFISYAQLLNFKLLYISELGGVTLGYYAIHQSLIKLIHVNNIGFINTFNNLWMQIFYLFILTLLLTFIAYWLLHKFKITSKLFLGK